MKPHEFPLDSTWKDLADRRVVAEAEVEKAGADAIAHGYSSGRLEALAAAEQRLADIEQAIHKREETISHPAWGTY